MDFDYLMEDVNKLCTKICQEYSRFVIPKEWKDKLMKDKDRIFSNPKLITLYKQAFNKIDEIGIDNYDFGNMDITIIRAIFNNSRIINATEEMKYLINSIGIQKNENKSHYAYDEKVETLFKKAIISLSYVESLINESIKTKDFKENIIIDEIEYNDFLKKYNYQIKKLEQKVIVEFSIVLRYQLLIKDINNCIVKPDLVNIRFEEIYDDIYNILKNKNSLVLLELSKKGAKLDIPKSYIYYLENVLNNETNLNNNESKEFISSIIIKLLNSDLDNSYAVFYANIYLKKFNVKNFCDEELMINAFVEKGFKFFVTEKQIYLVNNQSYKN
ncbi:MAG: hypothetical protein MR775_03400 [Erysipelotrichaceae bacterium]|nr:hypothetical protein [Erysipelotrichaceae bacterium]